MWSFSVHNYDHLVGIISIIHITNTSNLTQTLCSNFNYIPCQQFTVRYIKVRANISRLSLKNQSLSTLHIKDFPKIGPLYLKTECDIYKIYGYEKGTALLCDRHLLCPYKPSSIMRSLLSSLMPILQEWFILPQKYTNMWVELGGHRQFIFICIIIDQYPSHPQYYDVWRLS